MSARTTPASPELRTPCLLLEREVLARSCARMLARADELGVSLRPHLKTAKSVEVARLASRGPITVSTLREAAHFLEHGLSDLLYAVGISPDKLEACAELVARGASLTVILDDLEVARALAREQARFVRPLSVLLELDVGQHRGGVDPEGPELLALADALRGAPRASLRGVLAHAGHAYGAADVAAIRAIAEEERRLAVRAAERLRAAGHAIDVVSVGSTPTAVHAAHLEGVTELRAGVYTLQDRFQHALGSCDEDDLALTVLATVVGVRRREGVCLIDAGSLALSADRSMDRFAGTRFGAGLGEVRDLDDAPLPGRPLVTSVNQEHGWIALGEEGPRLAVGDRVRIRPNHACITAAMHGGYHVLERGEVVAWWPRVNGW